MEYGSSLLARRVEHERPTPPKPTDVARHDVLVLVGAQLLPVCLEVDRGVRKAGSRRAAQHGAARQHSVNSRDTPPSRHVNLRFVHGSILDSKLGTLRRHGCMHGLKRRGCMHGLDTQEYLNPAEIPRKQGGGHGYPRLHAWQPPWL